MHHFPFAFSPSSTSRRMASERVGLSLCFAAHLSTVSRNSSVARSAIVGVLPVGGPPLFCITDIAFFIFGVTEKQVEGKGSRFRPGSNPEQGAGFLMPEAERMHSMPRLNTPADPARRRSLSTAAGVPPGAPFWRWRPIRPGSLLPYQRARQTPYSA